MTSTTGTPKQIANYDAALGAIPRPGGQPGKGAGCHQYLMKVARLGLFAGKPAADIEADIKRNIPSGGRAVSDYEIRQVVAAGLNTAYHPTEFTPPPPKFNPEALWVKFTRDETEEELEALLRGASPVSLNYDSRRDPVELLTRFYLPHEFVLVGEKNTLAPRRAADLVEAATRGALAGPQIAPNPFTGKTGLLADGSGNTLRGKSCIADFRYAVCEFDGIPLQKQYAFWLDQIENKRAPAVIIHSGGKSLHAWLPVYKVDAAAWEADVVRGLFPRILEPLGADAMFKNPAQYSRLPGVERLDKAGTPKGFQRILFLNKQQNLGWN